MAAVVTPPSSPRGNHVQEKYIDESHAGILNSPTYLKDLFFYRTIQTINNNEFTEMLYEYIEFKKINVLLFEQEIYHDLYSSIKENSTLRNNGEWLKLKQSVKNYRKMNDESNKYQMERIISICARDLEKYLSTHLHGSYIHFLSFYFYQIQFERLI